MNPQQHDVPMSPPTTHHGSVPPGQVRLLGAMAITLATSMVAQNVMFGVAGAPGYGDPLADVLVWHQENRGVVAVAAGQEALHVVLLLGLLSGLAGLVRSRGGAVASRLALAGGAVVSAVFALYAVLWVGTVLAAEGLTEPSPTFELVWQLHAAAFALALPALGITFLGAALATHEAGLTPPWQRVLAVVGAGLLLVAGACSLAIADGSDLIFVGLPGLFGWIVWLFATGTRLVRAGDADRQR